MCGVRAVSVCGIFVSYVPEVGSEDEYLNKYIFGCWTVQKYTLADEPIWTVPLNIKGQINWMLFLYILLEHLKKKKNNTSYV